MQCNIIEPIFDNTFIYDSYACRTGKGTHAAVDRYTRFARKNKYVLKCDIQKYFSSIDHEILASIISRKIKCEKTMWLIREIISSRSDKSNIMYFKSDDLFTPYTRKKGIPLGNLTSQFFANVYLNKFDHFIKQELRCKYYIRYVDDFVMLDNDKEHLHEIRAQAEEYLESLRLCIHNRKSRIYKVTDGIAFLGYRVFPEHRLLKKENVLHMRRKLKKMILQYHKGDIPLDKIQQSIQSWVGHAVHADTYQLRCRILGSAVIQRDGTRGAAGRFVEQQSRQRPV